jgi:hypothetical protein
MLQYEVGKMTQATDSLQAAVERETEVEKSAVTLIQGLADQVRQTSTDPQVQALADRINANAGALASAVAANTPATSTIEPVPAPAPAPASSDGL